MGKTFDLGAEGGQSQNKFRMLAEPKTSCALHAFRLQGDVVYAFPFVSSEDETPRKNTLQNKERKNTA